MTKDADTLQNLPEVEVRIYHADLNPELVSELVGVTPTFRTRAGEMRENKTTGRTIKGRTGTWLWRTSGGRSEDPLRLLDKAVQRVKPGLSSVKATWPDARVIFAFHLVDPDPARLVSAMTRIGDLGEIEASAGPDYVPMPAPPPAKYEPRRFG